MTEKEKQALKEWIGYEQPTFQEQRPRPLFDPEFRRRWEQWVKEQHDKFKENLNDNE